MNYLISQEQLTELKEYLLMSVIPSKDAQMWGKLLASLKPEKNDAPTKPVQQGN